MVAPTEQQRRIVAKGRLVSVVIAATMVLWLGGQWLGMRFGWPERYVFLFDLAALAGFFWALVVTYRIWLARRAPPGPLN